MWKKFNLALIVIALVLVCVRVADGLSRRTGPLPQPPKENAYPVLVAIATGLKKPSGDLAELTTNQVLALALTNQSSLSNVRKFVRSETVVPLETERGWSREHEDHVAQLKKLAILVGLQARAELLQGNTNGSAETHLDLLLLGHVMARGGILSDAINGLAVETIGVAMLRGQVGMIDVPTAQTILRQLELADSRRDSPEQVFDTERKWSRRTFGLIGMVGGALRGSDHEKKFVERQTLAVSRHRKLILATAARVHQLEQGSWPESPNSLVPRILKVVPADPETGRPFTDIPALNP